MYTMAFSAANVFLLLLIAGLSKSLMRPQENELREMKCLDGLWSFRYSPINFTEKAPEEDWSHRSVQNLNGTILMPVPSSYNDITQEKNLRDHVGWVWYQRTFIVPRSWSHNRTLVLRFDSVHYFARVWLNGKFVVEHEGGHLPFEADVTLLMNFSSPNLLTVAVNNTLTPFTLPCGQIVRPVGPMYPSGYFRQELIFDFFNYAGIHRSVCLLSLPEPHVTGLLLHPEVVTRLDGPAVGNVWYVVESSANNSGFAAANVSCAVKIFDKDGTIVFESGSSCTGTADLDSPRLWWPIGSESQEVGHMYQLEVILLVDSHVVDIYRQSFGLRSVKVEADGLYINDKLFYFCGFGKHEDFHVFGRGFNLPLMVKDFSLMAWTGANSFRTSHYPYAEEVMEYADQHGVVVIDESPAVGLHEFPNETLKHHQRVMEELVDRDYLHPSVVMWSVANEPKSTDRQAEYYFRTVFDHVRKLDPSRPVTFVIGGSNASLDRAAQFADIICLNHYYGWYTDTGVLNLVSPQLMYDVKTWRDRFQKPVIMTEYGADTIAGLHTSPSFVFSEEYQVELMAEYFTAFDQLRAAGILAGEMVWNFADFMTDQQVNRVWGNRKGIFTRERQPKAGAHVVRQRYHSLASRDSHNSSELRNLAPEHLYQVISVV